MPKPVRPIAFALALLGPALAAPASVGQSPVPHATASDPAPVSAQVAPVRTAPSLPDTSELPGPDSPRLTDLKPASQRALRRAYRGGGYQPLWLRGGDTRRARAVIDVLAQADRHALDPADYDAQALRAAIKDMSAAERAAVDVWLTRAVLAYGEDITGGRIDHAPLRGGKIAPAGGIDSDSVLADIVRADDPGAALAELAPHHDAYRRLASKRQAYLAVAEAGGWRAIPPGRVLGVGMRGPRVAAVRERLAADARLNGDADSGQRRYGPYGQRASDGPDRRPRAHDYFDRGLAQRVKAFQRRHGLTADGYVGPKTRQAMNVSARERAREIALNMERWRWLPHELGWRYIKVNIPAYELEAVYQGRREFRMDVTVGEKDRPTPSFSHHLRYLSVNPDWTIPNSIAVRDILPEQRADADYLEDHRIEVYESWREDAETVDPDDVDWDEVAKVSKDDWDSFPYQLRQAPGGSNPLGNVKFMFPNPHSIYLHDTPAMYEFQRQQRTFSSGCVRVRHPKQLAAHLLGQATRREHVAQLLEEAGTEERVPLDHPVPIHLVYHTTWVDADGRLQVRPDVYDRNAELQDKLDSAQPQPRQRDSIPASAEADEPREQRAELD